MQRTEDLTLCEMIEPRSCQSVEHKPEHNESQVAIENLSARLVCERLIGNCGNCPLLLAVRNYIEGSPRRQARCMGEKLANRNWVFVRTIEFEQVVRNGTVQGQLAQLNQPCAEKSGHER